MVTPEVPTGRSIGQAIFGDETDSPLLHATGVAAVGQGQVGKIDGKATTTAGAAMAGESDHQIDGPFRPGVTEVMQGATAHSVAAGAAGAARAAACRPVAAAPLDPRPGQVFDTSDALGDIRDILTWISHRLLS
jgi:hypothetical protein